MKKIIIGIIITVFIISLYLVTNFIPGIFSGIGKNSYLKKDYKNAYKNFKISLMFNPKEKETRYYFVQTLFKLTPNLKIQKEMFVISQLNLADSADLISDRQVSKWKNQISSSIGENYIEQTPYENKVLRWNLETFPLKVYFENSAQKELPQYYLPTIKSAFGQWQKASANLIKFAQTNDKNQAQILVKIVPIQKISNCTQQDCKYTLAYTLPEVKGNLLKKMEINFYASDNLGNPFDKKNIYNTALHEIGHALGIMGHSYNKENIMYMQASRENGFNFAKSDFQMITPADLNTLKLLYRLFPDITNTPEENLDKSGLIFAPIVLGSEKQINSRKILEAQNCINSASNLPNGYIDLASAYVQEQEYNMALEALDKALSLCSNDDERFIVNYNYAVIYMNIKDFEMAMEYAQKAKQFKAEDEIDGLIAAINFNKGNKDFAKQSYIQALEKHPESIIDSINLTKIYLKELNFIQAGKVLNNLVNANPEAKNDKRLKPFGLLMFVFR